MKWPVAVGILLAVTTTNLIISDYQIKYSHGGEPPDAPLEEPPAAVARLDAVVLPARLVAANLAQHVHLLLHRRIVP